MNPAETVTLSAHAARRVWTAETCCYYSVKTVTLSANALPCCYQYGRARRASRLVNNAPRFSAARMRKMGPSAAVARNAKRPCGDGLHLANNKYLN